MSLERSYRISHRGATHAGRYAIEFDDDHTVKGVLWKIEQDILAQIVARPTSAPTRVLDFACGTGRVLRWLTTAFADGTDVTGVDISEAMLAQAASNAPGATLVQGDVTTQSDLVAGEFDLVTMFRFLLNAEPELRDAVLAWLSRHVRMGGYLVFNVHRNSSSLSGLLARLRRRQRRSSGPRTMSLREAVDLVSAHGFTPVVQYGYGYLPYRPYGAARLRAPRLALAVERLLAGRGARVRLASHVIIAARRTFDTTR